MSWLKFDLVAIKAIPIQEVILFLGGEVIKKRFCRCFNSELHNNNDKKPSLVINFKNNTCKCFACGAGGSNIDIVMQKYNISFREACQFLHDNWNIPYIEGDENERRNYQVQAPQPPKEKEITYWVWDDKWEGRKTISLSAYRHKIPNMKEQQKLRWAYTYVYRASLQGEQTPKINYLRSRGIKTKWEEKVGYISYEKARSILQNLKNWFSDEELEKLNLKYIPGNCIVFPSFAIETNMTEGLMLRLLGDNRPRKEHAVSCPGVEFPLPFGMMQEIFQKSDEIWITEGAIDSLSLRTAFHKKSFVALPGAQTWRDEMAGLFKGKKVIIAFDNDSAGIAGSHKIAESLQKYGVQTEFFSWEGEENDLNELLVNERLQEAVYKFESSEERVQSL